MTCRLFLLPLLTFHSDRHLAGVLARVVDAKLFLHLELRLFDFFDERWHPIIKQNLLVKKPEPLCLVLIQGPDRVRVEQAALKCLGNRNLDHDRLVFLDEILDH